MGGNDGVHGFQSMTPIYTVSEGGILPSDMARGEVGPASEGGTSDGLAIRISSGVPIG